MADYITKAELLAEVKRARELGYCTEELGAMFILMVNKYITHPWWNQYTYKEDMCGMALLNLSAGALKYDPDRYDNPFGYYTQIMKTSFLQVKYYEKKHRDIRDKALVKAGLDPSASWLEEQLQKEAEEKAQRNANVDNEVEEMPEKEEETATKTIHDLFEF